MTVEVSSPGKLFLAGEYAVVEAGYPAVIAAMNQRLYVRISPSEKGLLYSSQQADNWLIWYRDDARLKVDQAHSYHLLLAAMQEAEDYLRACGHEKLPFYTLQVHSDLDDRVSGTKYGLGSSGAVTVAVIKAILTYFGQDYTSLLLYKLAALTQTKLGMVGSFGDLAASSFEGVIAYYSVDRQWLCQIITEYALLEIVEMQWQGLQVIPLHLPEKMHLLVGWTGKAASTDQLVHQLHGEISQEDKELYFQAFLRESKNCVESLISAFESQDRSTIKKAIRKNRDILQEFSKVMGISIETPSLNRLCEIAEKYGAAAKTSGAGGGDCGICLLDNSERKQAIFNDWQKEGIQPLDMSIAYGK